MKIKFIRSATALLLALAMVFCCVGCGGDTTTQTGGKDNQTADGKISLTVTVSSAELGKTDAFSQYMIDHPNVIINEIPTTNGDTKLLSMIASGDAPDLIRFTTYDELPVFVQRGILLPLDDYLSKSDTFNIEDMYECIETCHFDGFNRGQGHYYGIPKDWSPCGLWINKNAFADAGVPLPSTTKPMTWDEFADIAQRLVKMEGKEVKRHGFITALQFPTLLEMYLSSYGKSLWTDDYNGTTLQTAETKKAVNFFLDMQKTAAMTSSLYPSADKIGQSALNQDKVGMVIAGYWFRGAFAGAGILSDVSEKLMYVPAPVGDRQTTFALDLVGLGIFSQTEYPDEAYDLLEYLTLSEETVLARSSIGFNMPVAKKYTDTLPKDDAFDKQLLSVLQDYQIPHFAPTDAKVCPWISYVSLNTLFDKFYLPILYGKTDLDTAMKTIDSETKILIEEGKELVGAK